MDRRETEVVTGLLEAYREGAFPMADPKTGRMEWFSPNPRAVMPLERTGAKHVFHVSKSLEAKLRSGRFAVTSDEAFEMVVRSCAEPRPERRDSWIDERIIWAYTALHRAGHAHSVETWLPAGERERRLAEERDEDDSIVTPVLSADGSRVLVGGVYGVSIGGAFFAESMFCRPELGEVKSKTGVAVVRPGTDASKVCLVRLVEHLRARGYTLMDVQLRNSHTDQFGVYEISRKEYLRRLEEACAIVTEWGEIEH